MPESQRDLRRKRTIIGEIQQITRAMKLVSAAKLKRTLARREAARLYRDQLSETLALTGQRVRGLLEHPWLEQRQVKRIGVLVIGGDKGLCGGFNANIVAAAREIADQSEAPAEVMTVGARTGDIARRAGLNITARLPAVEERQAWLEALAIAQRVAGLYEAGKVDSLYVAYARFMSRVAQVPSSERLLPMEGAQRAEEWDEEYIFEPGPAELYAHLLPRYLHAEVYRLVLDSAASEHSARLMAMTAATDNADEMIEQLTRHINRARQQDITRELLDVVAGADALAQRM